MHLEAVPPELFSLESTQAVRTKRQTVPPRDLQVTRPQTLQKVQIQLLKTKRQITPQNDSPAMKNLLQNPKTIQIKSSKMTRKMKR